MASDYTGNPSAAQSPSPAPGPGIIQTVRLPADGDALNAASVAQAWKTLVDRQAFDAYPGRVCSFRERWDIAAATLTNANTGVIADLAKRWTWFISAGTTQTATFQNPSTAGGNYACRNVKLNQGTGNAAQVSGLWTSFPIWEAPSVTYRALYEFDVQATSSTLNSREWHIGLTSGASGFTNEVGFYSDYTLANWQANTGGAFTDTGVAVSVGTTWVRLAFLIDTTLGTPSVTFYINGTLSATRTVNLPAAGTDYYLVLGGRQTLTGVCSFTVGDVVGTWTKF